MDDSADRPHPAPRWARAWLRAAGVYNLAWGALVILAPGLLFRVLDMPAPNYPWLWQCIGMLVGAYGVGYLLAARDPIVHWPIVAVGLLGKVLGPLGFAWTAARGEIPVTFGLTILTNDLVWWPAFAGILWLAARAASAPLDSAAVDFDQALDRVLDLEGRSLRAVSSARPTVVLFIRHSGCTFCREALADLSRKRAALAEARTGIAVVGMSDPGTLRRLAEQFGLTNAAWFSDPERTLYRAFELRRGGFWQLFGPSVWIRGIAATLRGHVVGRLDGDGFQMPGAFLVHAGRIVRAYRHETAADRPDLEALACPRPGTT